jgi:antirestriction protein ArdC
MKVKDPGKTGAKVTEAVLLMRKIASSIIDQIDKGYDPPGSSPSYDSVSVPVSNAATKHNYTGGNRWLLAGETVKSAWNDPRFLTFRQCVHLKDADGKPAKIRDGEYPRKILRPLLLRKKVEINQDDIGSVPEDKLAQEGDKYFKAVDFTVFKTINVFNVSQTTAVLPPPVGLTPRQWMDNDFFEKFVNAAGISVVNDNPAVIRFDREKNLIHMPDKDAFPTPDSYYSILMHEFFHATGHTARENRTVGESGSDEYAREELRAELFSTACAQLFGLNHPREKNVDYIDHWRKYLNDNKTSTILKASTDVDRTLTAIMDVAAGKQPNLAWFPKVDFSDMPTPLKKLNDAVAAQEARDHVIVVERLDKSEEPLEVCRAVLPAEQFHVMERGLTGSNGDYYRQRVEDIAHSVHEMPGMYAQEPYGTGATARLHFSGDGSEYFLTELSVTDDLAYGYKVDENGATSFDEIPLREIRETAARLDLEFEPRTVNSLIREYGEPQTDGAEKGEMPSWVMSDYGGSDLDDYNFQHPTVAM